MSSSQKTSLHVPVLVYFTSPLSQQERSLLLSQLNEPNAEFLEPYPELPELFHQSPAGNEIEGKTTAEVVEIHKQWVEEQEVRWNAKHAGSGSKFKSWPGSYMFVIAGDKTSPHATSSKVQIIHLPDGSAKDSFDIKSVRTASAAGVVNVAHADGWNSEGIADDVDDDDDTTTGGGGGAGSTEQASADLPPMTLPTKPRPDAT
ncbi:hypothetical protein HWV62_27417 [Athelia sp. TMB]|nr:hypothetical protein HWV62_27417 [Athelia sp. TMB]